MQGRTERQGGEKRGRREEEERKGGREENREGGRELTTFQDLLEPNSVHCTVSPLHMNLQVVNFQRCKHASLVRSHKLVHMSGVHCHVRASSISGCAFVYFTVLYRVQ